MDNLIKIVAKLSMRPISKTVIREGNTYSFKYMVSDTQIDTIKVVYELKSLIRSYVVCTLYINEVEYKSTKVTLDDMSKVHFKLSKHITKCNIARKNKDSEYMSKVIDTLDLD